MPLLGEASISLSLSLPVQGIRKDGNPPPIQENPTFKYTQFSVLTCPHTPPCTPLHAVPSVGQVRTGGMVTHPILSTHTGSGNMRQHKASASIFVIGSAGDSNDKLQSVNQSISPNACKPSPSRRPAWHCTARQRTCHHEMVVQFRDCPELYAPGCCDRCVRHARDL